MIYDIIFIPAITLIIWTISNSMIKNLASKINTNDVSMIVVGAGIIPMMIGIMINPVHGVSPSILLLSSISGILLGLGYILFYKSLKSENLGNAGVTINIQQIVVIVFGLFVLKENVTSFALPGILLIIFGSILATVRKGFRVNKILIIAAAANIIWGVYYIPLTFAILSLHASPVPLLLARIMGFFSVLLLFNFPSILRRIRSRIKIENVRGAKIASALIFSSIIAGLLDGAGNVLYALSIQDGIIIIAGSMIALLPVTLALTGKFIFHEKLTSMQYSGILLSVTGAVLIAIL